MAGLAHTPHEGEGGRSERAVAFSDSYVALPDSVAEGRRALVEVLRGLGIPGLVLDDIALGVSEACTNVVLHAYDDGAHGHFALTCRVDAATVEVVVEDDGRGLTPRPDSAGLGLGLPLMASVAAGVVMSATDSGGTRVTMVFDRDDPRLH